MIIKIDSDRAASYAIKVINALVYEQPMQVTIEPFKQKRSGGQNRYLWAALINDFVTQGFVNGRLYGAESWHFFLKKELLPELPEPDEALPGYQKWTETPDGTLILTGSTTKLTTKGFTNYIEKCYAYGCELGIRFSAK
ncbi:MAG: recombination protein NinB [Candidatus Rickettsiella isopodorum]|nr:recombination protein NinB [Candidatus Rickettsiella isopodorum]